MVYYLFFGIFSIMVISWIMIRDPLSPICIVCEVFAVSSYFAIISANDRNIDISQGTVLYILLQLGISLVLAKFMHVLGGRITQENSFERIELIKQRYLILLIIMIVFTILYVVIVGRAIHLSSGGGISQKFFSFRQSTITGESSIPAYAIYLTKGIYAFAYFSIYIYIHNKEVSRITGEHVRSDRWYLVSVLPLLSVAILSGARAEIIYFICAILTYYSILRCKTRKKAIPIKSIIKIAIIILLILFAFYQLSFLFGRGGKSISSYLGGYFGGSIIAFDRFLESPVSRSDIWGIELFYSIVHFLQKIGLAGGELISVHQDYVYINGMIYTNVYTCFRAYVADLGIIGSYFIQLVFIYFYEKIYLKILNRNNMCGFVNMKIIIFGLISYGIYLTFYSNYLFALVFSIHTIIQIFLILFYRWFTTTTRFSIDVNSKIRI